jgi:hypothetical protein
MRYSCATLLGLLLLGGALAQAQSDDIQISIGEFVCEPSVIDLPVMLEPPAEPARWEIRNYLIKVNFDNVLRTFTSLQEGDYSLPSDWQCRAYVAPTENEVAVIAYAVDPSSALPLMEGEHSLIVLRFTAVGKPESDDCSDLRISEATLGGDDLPVVTGTQRTTWGLIKGLYE